MSEHVWMAIINNTSNVLPVCRAIRQSQGREQCRSQRRRASCRTKMATSSVPTSEPTKMRLATMRLGSSIDLSCSTGPARKKVLPGVAMNTHANQSNDRAISMSGCEYPTRKHTMHSVYSSPNVYGNSNSDTACARTR